MTKKSKKPSSALQAAITGVFGYVPPDVLTNAELSRTVDDKQRMDRRPYRHRGTPYSQGQGTRHLAHGAPRPCRGLLEKTGTAPDDVDLLICATTTPDMVFPSTANLICDLVDIRNVGSFDVQAACSGFVYALTIAVAIR